MISIKIRIYLKIRYEQLQPLVLYESTTDVGYVTIYVINDTIL